jgi:predicted phosphodiesterase
MKIAVISDLHLGGHDESEFLRFLRFLESNFERIVLLGDIWETLTGIRYGNAAAELDRARDAHPEIARRFRQPRYTYIHGNHDIVAGITERAPEALELRADGMRLLFTHGHHHDVLIRRARWLSELGVWLGGWILRLRLSPLYSAFNSLDEFRSGIAVDGTRCSFQRWAMSVARTRGADVVVTGHTHFANRTEHGAGLFLNSGSCANGKYSYLSIDTRSSSFGVHTSF